MMSFTIFFVKVDDFPVGVADLLKFNNLSKGEPAVADHVQELEVYGQVGAFLFKIFSPGFPVSPVAFEIPEKAAFQGGGEPGRPDIVIVPFAPIQEFVFEHEGVQLMDKDIVVVEEPGVKFGGEHEAIVAAGVPEIDVIEGLYFEIAFKRGVGFDGKGMGFYQDQREMAQHSTALSERDGFVFR
jgi:hypothetical protein